MVNALAQMADAPVLIIGDMVADVYLDGTIARISREAPVLVLEQREARMARAVRAGAARAAGGGYGVHGVLLVVAGSIADGG